MRIHEIIEHCVEYISFDGALGSDPKRLIQYLIKLDPSLDQDYFTHLWTLLCAHPSIQIIITNEPILLPGGTVDLGTAPLPEGWIPPQGMQGDVDYSTLYKEGYRGRQIAFILAGQEFRSDKQAIQDKKEANRKKAKKAKQANLKRNKDKDDEDSDDEVKVDPSGAGILRVLHVDDSEEGENTEPVPKSDLRTLWEKWGARLRIRCTEDEIYYRLTGSHAKIPKITATVFHVLQLAAMSREKGITAIDLGPLVGSSQGSMHYFMKVLVQLGLCAKVPAVLHASITNLLVFHRYLDENPNYRALVGKPLKPLDDEVVQANENMEDGAEEQDSGDEQVDPSLDDPSEFTDWGFDFPGLSEADLMAGHSVKQRLLKMLEHPKLQNHLLRTKNLLPVVGWTGPAVMRHRRAIKRHIDTLAADGLVERVYVGETRTSCIRLSKYNPNSVKVETVGQEENGVIEIPERMHDLDVISAQAPYTPPLDPQISNIPLTVTFEHWIIDLVLQSEQHPEEDQRGMTISAIWRNTNYIYKRSIDFAILRSDNAHVPEHLWPNSISSFMETVKKERRLRLFTTAEFQRIMYREGQVLEGYPAMPRPEIAGDFGDISYKNYYESENQLNQLLDSGKIFGATKAPKKIGGPLKAKSNKSKAKSGAARSADADSIADDVMDEEEDDELDDKGKRDFKYSNGAQVRGRPRKYVHVVEEDGKVNRRIIGTIYSRDDLPQVLVYLKDRNLLVTAEAGYSGVGPPPPPNEEAIKEGKSPEFYFQFPARDPAAFSGLPGRKSKARAEKEGVEGTDQGNGKTKKGGKANKGKKRAKGNGNSGSDPGTPTTTRKSKRQKKDVNYNAAMELDHPEDVPPAAVVHGPTTTSVQNDDTDPRLVGSTTTVSSLPIINHPINDNDIDPALIETPSIPLAIPAQDPVPIPVPQTNLPSTETASSAPAAETLPVESQTTARQTKKRGKGKKDQEVQVKQENVDTPKRQRPPRKSKAAQKADTTAAVRPPATEAEVVPPIPKPTNDVPRQIESTPGSRFFPIDIPDDSIFERSMEASIGTVLAELSHSGVRPLPPPTAEVIAAGANSITTSPTPLLAAPAPTNTIFTDTPANTTGGTAKKRKAVLSANLAPTKSSKSKKGKSSIITSKALEREASQVVGNGRTPFFNLPEEPMEEMPFELPDDIVAIANSTPKQPAVNTVDLAEPAKKDAAVEAVGLTTPTSPIHAPDRQQSYRSVDVINMTEASDPTLIGTKIASPPVVATPPRPPSHQTPVPATSASRFVTPLRELSAGPSRPASTPASPANSSRAASSTPLRETSQQPPRNLRLLHAAKGASRPGRVDLGSIRRANELVQVLQDSGGVLVDTRLIHEHRNWAFKYAGTDHPHAPASGYGMDRLVIKKLVNILLGDGRFKETIVSIPTPTGRWVKSIVLYLSDLPHEQLQAYIRQMSSSLTQSMTPNSVVRKDKQGTATLPETPFTELKLAHKSGTKMAVDATPTRSNAFGAPRPFSERRTALLQELKVVGQLLGWKASRCVRAQILHRAIIKALSKPDCGSVVSTSPRIFAFPLLCEEITAEEWFACCLVLRYNEEIEHWLRDPVNRATKTKDVPKRFRPLGGFGGSSTKAKMNTLLQVMVALKIITPVTPVAKEEADFFADNAEHNGFKVEEHHVSTTYFVLHDLVPVYHIASVPPPLLGLLPARTSEDLNDLWSNIKKASLEMRVDLLGRIGEQTKPGLPHSAKISDILDISMDHTKLLTRPKRWRSDLDLIPIQKAALDGIFDRTTGQSSINTRQELEDFAYENALPIPFLEKEISKRSELAKNNAIKIAERIKEQAIKVQERQNKIQEDIRKKLIERQAIARKSWEDKVNSSAIRKNVEYNIELLTFISKQTIKGGSMKMSDVNDNIIDHWVMIWDQIKLLSPKDQELYLEERRRSQIERVKLTQPKFKCQSGTKRRAAKKVEPPKTGLQKRLRSKRKWTLEDDDLMLDAEAIIRARSRNNGYKGRQAMTQIFPDSASSTLRSRLNKIYAQPGKKAYFDRLEQAWYEIWIKIRNTGNELIDENIENSIDFNLKDCITALRRKIDKKPLRLLAVTTPTEEKERAPELPSYSYEIAEEYVWKYVKTEQHSFDQVADSISAEEIRTNSIGSISLLEETKLKAEIEIDSKEMGILQAAMKIIVGTPDEIYDAARGQKLLENWPTESYQIAIQDMLEKNVLRKLPTPSRDNERQYGFSQGWQQLNEGFLPPNLTQDAQHLPPKLEPDEGIEWPLIGESGALAALMNMISNHEVDFDFDVNEFPTVKYEKGHFNTRKLDDDAYEFPLQVKRISPSTSLPASVSLPDAKMCKSLTQWKIEVPEDSGEVQGTVEKVIEAVNSAAEEGITKPGLLDAIQCSPGLLGQALASLSTEDEQRVFWAGYDTARLVSRDYWVSWSIKVTPIIQVGEEIVINPRRWVDLYGEIDKEDFEKVVECTKSLIITRPGISLRTLKERLNMILDRLELIEVLDYLIRMGKIEIKWSTNDNYEKVVPPIEAVGVEEEEEISLFPVVNEIW